MQSECGTEPGTLIRTPEGRITYWSAQLERRYGFSAEESLGQVSHELLRARHWQHRNEIAAVLTTRSEWRGGLIVYRADNQPVMVANHWHLHRGADGLASVVTEVHSDIVPPGTTTSNEMADIVTTFAQDLSQPLTALGGFIGGTQRTMRSASPDHSLMDHGLSEAAAQLDRASSMVARVRALGDTLRDPRLRALHERLANAVDQSKRLMREARAVQTASKAALESDPAARPRTRETGEERALARQAEDIPVVHAFALQSIQVYQRRLDLLRSERRDAHAQRVLLQLLQEEEAKLIALQQPAIART